MITNILHKSAFLRQAMALCFALMAWAMVCTGNSVQAAGCAHASAASKQLGNEKGLEPSLLGKWQYVGGQVYYLFHPLPEKCEGPGCRQAPEPGSEMTIVPPVVQRSMAPAICPVDSLYTPHQYRSACDLEDRFVASPVLAGILRPPMA